MFYITFSDNVPLTGALMIIMVLTRLKELRKEANLTQEEVDNILCFHLGTYGEYESGDKILPIWMLMMLSKYYGVSMPYLLGETDIRL